MMLFVNPSHLSCLRKTPHFALNHVSGSVYQHAHAISAFLMHFPTHAAELHRDTQGISAVFLIALCQTREKWKNHVTWPHEGRTVIITDNNTSDADKTNPAGYKHMDNSVLNEGV